MPPRNALGPRLKPQLSRRRKFVRTPRLRDRLLWLNSGVRDYLVTQGIPMTSIAARGFGKTQPVASNDTAAGRQRNRRVELVVSGDIIGSKVTTMRNTV